LLSPVILTTFLCVTVKTVALGQPIPITSLISLISQPEKYSEKSVVVMGYATFGFENSYLYLSPYDARHSLKQDALWLNIKNYQFTNLRSLDHRTITVEGIFRLPKNGAYWTNYPNGFIEVTKLGPRDSVADGKAE
jgi:hypothetical protein